MKIISIVIAIFIAGLAFFLVDLIASRPKPFSAIVVDKHYKPSITTTGSGYGVTSSGKVGVIVTSQHESEEFLLIVKKINGNIVTVKCRPELYYKKQVGNKINCQEYSGRFTGMTYSLDGVE
jgi:hypothetical protein